MSLGKEGIPTRHVKELIDLHLKRTRAPRLLNDAIVGRVERVEAYLVVREKKESIGEIKGKLKKRDMNGLFWMENRDKRKTTPRAFQRKEIRPYRGIVDLEGSTPMLSTAKGMSR